MCFVTTIDSFFLARGLVANFRFRQRHPLSLPQQHPSCCYGNNIPSSAVYSVQDPPHTSQAAWGDFGRQHGAVCFMSDHVLKIMKGEGFQHKEQCVTKVNLLAPEKITFCCANLTLRRLMSYIYIYIYGAPILDVSRSHTTTQHSR